MAEPGLDPVTGEVLETPEMRESGLRELRAKMSADTDVQKWPRDDDQFLLPFLRARKYNVDKAFHVIKNFAKFWYGKKDLINGLCAAKVRDIYNMGMMQFLPNTKDVNGNVVTALRMGNIDFANPAYNAHNMMALSVYILCQVFESEHLQRHGCCYVETMEGFSLGSAMKMGKVMDSKEQKEMMSLAVDTFPMRIRDIYVIHQPWYFNLFWAIVKPFMKAKLTKRLHLLGKDLETLHKVVAPSGLPAEFGGTLDEPIAKFLDDMERQERETGMIGGFAFPLDVDDPTGSKRRAAGKFQVQGTSDSGAASGNGTSALTMDQISDHVASLGLSSEPA